MVLNIAGSDQRQDDLFSAESLLAKGRSALKGLKGVENVYMQHTPHLSETLENLFKGRLRDTTHPFLDGAGPNASLQRYAFAYHVGWVPDLTHVVDLKISLFS